MRVLHLATSGWSAREGIARAVQAVVERVPGEHHLSATAADGDMFAAVHELDGGSAPLPWSARLSEVVGAVRPDVIHIHGGIGAAAVAVGLPTRGAAIVLSAYGRVSPPSWRQADSRQRRVANMTIPRRMAVHGVGLPLLRAALARGTVAAVCSPDRAIVNRLVGYGPAFLAQGAAEPSARRAVFSERPRVVFAGRAERGRGVDDLLLASLLVRRRRPEVRFVLALLPSPTSHRWQDLSLNGVEIHIGQAHDLDALFATAQVAALPFRVVASVTPALVAAEAMAVGLPVVGTDVGCLRTLVRDGHNGRLVAPGAPEALADAVLDTVAHRDHWEQLSQQARMTIEHDWHWDNAATAVSRAYEAALGRGVRAAA